jgi:hypothetical protein
LKLYTKRQQLEILRSQLDNERSTFTAHWRDLSDFVQPRRARFYTSDVNKGDRRNQKIIDSTATMALRTLRSGMVSGITSPARPWFRLTTPDPELAEFGAVKMWLHQVQRIMTTSMLKSNLYNTLPVVYGDLGLFGTAPMSVEESFTGDVFHTQSFPVGSYMIAKNDIGMVDTFVREFRMTVRQVVQKFGINEAGNEIDWSNISSYVKNLWDINQTEQWIEIVHTIMPNPEYDPRKLESKYKKFKSVYYERGLSGNTSQGYLQSGDDEKMLSEKGYDYFPILCPRWEVTGEDVYGTDCPGMLALGDVKQLQLGERRLMEAIEKMIRPPMVGPATLKNQSASILPGDITYLDMRDSQAGFRPAHEVNFRIQEMEMKQNQVRNRIQRAFFEDLFLMLASSDRRQITAREIEERHEEKLLALGPVLEQLNQDLLDPLIDIVFDIHLRQKLLPPIPEELQGMDLKVEYISIMAQAQKLVGIQGIERMAGFTGQLASMDPNVLKKVKFDQMIDVYADIISLDPGIVRTDDEMAEMQAQEQAAAAQQNAMMEAQAVAQTAKTLSDTQIQGDNALSGLLSQANAGNLVG